jgi:replicative DNA helicase
MVCFIHRPEYYKIWNDEQGRNMRGMAEFIIAKHRNGAVDTVIMRFRSEYARFQDTDEDDYIPMPGESKALESQLNSNATDNAPSPANEAPLPEPLGPATDNDSPFGAPTPTNDMPF